MPGGTTVPPGTALTYEVELLQCQVRGSHQRPAHPLPEAWSMVGGWEWDLQPAR